MVAGESFVRNSESFAVQLRIASQPHLVCVCSSAEWHLALWNLDRHLILDLFKVVAPHINILEWVVLDKVLVATVGITARARDLTRSESVEGPDRLHGARSDLHRIRLL